MWSSHTTVVRLSKQKKKKTGTSLWTKVQTLFGLYQLFHKCSLCSRIQPATILHPPGVALRVLWSASVFPCFSWPFQFWGVLIRYFVECPSMGVCLRLFSGVTGLGKNTTGRRCLPHHIVLGVHDSHLTCHGVVVTLITRSRWCLPGVSTIHFLLFSFPTLLFRSKSLSPGHIQRKRRG